MMQSCVASLYDAFVYLCEAGLLCLSQTPDRSNKELNDQ